MTLDFRLKNMFRAIPVCSKWFLTLHITSRSLLLGFDGALVSGETTLEARPSVAHAKESPTSGVGNESSLVATAASRVRSPVICTSVHAHHGIRTLSITLIRLQSHSLGLSNQASTSALIIIYDSSRSKEFYQPDHHSSTFSLILVHSLRTEDGRPKPRDVAATSIFGQ